MSVESPTRAGPEPAMTALVAGAIDDVQELLKQQLALFKHEVRQDVRKARDASISLAFGGVILLVGGVLLALTGVHLLQALAPALPLWACYAIVGVLVTATGGAFIYSGKKQVESFQILPEESLQSLKENFQWMRNPK